MTIICGRSPQTNQQQKIIPLWPLDGTGQVYTSQNVLSEKLQVAAKF